MGAVTTHVPSLSSFRPAEPRPQPFQECSGRAVPSLFEAAVSPLTSSFADLSQAAEQSVFMGPHRAGACAFPFRGALCRCKARLKMFLGRALALPCGAVFVWLALPGCPSRVCSPKAFPRKLLWQLKRRPGWLRIAMAQRFFLDYFCSNFSAGNHCVGLGLRILCMLCLSISSWLSDGSTTKPLSIRSGFLQPPRRACDRFFRSVRKA